MFAILLSSSSASIESSEYLLNWGFATAQKRRRNENNLEIKKNNKEEIEEVKEKYWWLHSATQKNFYSSIFFNPNQSRFPSRSIL